MLVQGLDDYTESFGRTFGNDREQAKNFFVNRQNQSLLPSTARAPYQQLSHASQLLSDAEAIEFEYNDRKQVLHEIN